MKTRIVLAGILAMMMAVEVSAQRAENDDMYFRGKDRQRNRSIEAESAYASSRIKTQKPEEVTAEDEDTNPTDSYSARNVNPEYVSRSNSEQASEDEGNYYLEGYTPASASTADFNNSYYNNVNWARTSYYGNARWGSPYYGNVGFYDPWMNPYYGGFYDPWMMPNYGFGPSYGWRTGWSLSLAYGNYWSPWGVGGYPYYGYNPGYYYGGGGYYRESYRANYGKRPSRHSAVVTPSQRQVSRSRTEAVSNTTNVNSRTRTRQPQDDYYVRPARRSTLFNSGVNPANSGSNNNNSGFPAPSARPSRSRDVFSQPSYTPSQTPSYSPSRDRSGGSGGNSGGGGGGSSPRPRGRG